MVVPTGILRIGKVLPVQPVGHASDVAARWLHALDQLGGHRVGDGRVDDGNGARGPLLHLFRTLLKGTI